MEIKKTVVVVVVVRLPEHFHAIRSLTKTILITFGSNQICGKPFSVEYFENYIF